jgi:hypothetical protein
MRFNIASFVLLASFVIAINAKNDINRVKIARRSDIGSQRSSLLYRRDDGSAAPSATDPTAAVAPAASDSTAAATGAGSGAASDAAAAAPSPPAPKWNPSASVDCSYNSDGCLTQASTHGCPIQVQPPKKGKGTSCSTGGGGDGGSDYKKRLFSLPNQLLNLDILNCDSLCLLSECPPQNDCSVQSSDGSFINVQALDCDNLYLLSSATKK